MLFPWQSDVEKILEPSQPVVVVGLVVIVLVSLYLIWKGGALERTSWLVFLLLP